MKTLQKTIALAGASFLLWQGAQAQTARLTIDVDKPGARVSPTLHGLFFEDINYGADGGLYAELVQNRSFEHRDNLFAWKTINRGGEGDAKVSSEAPLNAKNPRYVRLNIKAAGQGFGLANEGFDGIAVQANEKYWFAVHARGANYRGGLRAVLEDENGNVIAQSRLKNIGAQWQRLETVLTSRATTSKAKLLLLADGAGQVDVDVISLFPQNTWKKRRNGMRADLVQKLADMKPGFMRFPGGCIVEGKDLANAYRWKDTVGDIAARPQNWNRWQDAVGIKAPQYYQTYGLGFFEYFQLCEDIGAEPVPVLNCGMACQFQTGQLVPVAELNEWVQDALDLIEFANGPVNSKWGKLRAEMGHPKPFNLKYLGVGNEQWQAPYFERYMVFHKAIRAQYPSIQIVSSSGPGVDDAHWRFAWDKFKGGTPADIVDEHYYRSPSWFLSNDRRYDNTDRKGPKIFAGEFAAHGPARRSTLHAALTEAAFMTGLVRNADIVHMASYAPLFAKVGHTQWEPDLIWFDNARVYGTPSYYVQMMYGRNRPDAVLPLKLELPAPAPDNFAGGIGLGTWNTQAEFKDIKVTQGDKTLWGFDSAAGTGAWKLQNGDWKIQDGALRQNAQTENVIARIGDANWQNYTLSLKARKNGGAEGFLILVAVNGDDHLWWNIGGWNNTRSAFERSRGGDKFEVGRVTNDRIETGRWYDIKVEVHGDTIKAYLDNRLVSEIKNSGAPTASLYAVAGRDDKSGETIIKVVNPTAQAIPATLQLNGARRVAGAKATILSGAPDDMNSLDKPTNVAPREEKIAVNASEFSRTFAPHSFTILRVKTD
jgi:alpha-L-arabinofuranosidase